MLVVRYKQKLDIPEEMQTKPIGLWLAKMKQRWQISGALRAPINDIQIVGCGLCILGALCEAFIETAPEAKDMNAAWESTYYFAWDHAGERKKEKQWLPEPVATWWDRHHSDVVTAEQLTKMAPVMNDYCSWSFDKFSALIATKFGFDLIMVKAG